MKYFITVTEYGYKTVEIEANTASDAIKKVSETDIEIKTERTFDYTT